MSRNGLLKSVSLVIHEHIKAAERLMPKPTQAALLFHELKFKPYEWCVHSNIGYSPTMPFFYYTHEPVKYRQKEATHANVYKFMRYIIDNMRLATECIVISLIYLEKLMLTSKVEIRLCNWRPMLFTAILLASKFWDDISFWNVDFVEALEVYALKQVNRLESEFLSLCDYKLFVSADSYLLYRNEIR